MPPIRLTLALTSMLLALPSWTVAAPLTTATGNVRVSYDVDTFSFRGGSGEDGIAETIPLPTGSALLGFAGNTVTLSFSDATGAALYASALFNAASPTTTTGLGMFNASFAFSPQPGFVITGYKLWAEGVFDISQPGSVSLQFSSVAAALPPTTSGTNQSFIIGAASPGATAPALAGGFSATAATEGDPTNGTDFALGAARIDVRALSIEAFVKPVPEPSSWALMAAGLGVGLLVARRRARG